MILNMIINFVLWHQSSIFDMGTFIEKKCFIFSMVFLPELTSFDFVIHNFTTKR